MLEYIYFIGEKNSKGPIKIGFSKNPKLRLEALQVGYPHKLYILGMIQGNKQLEYKIHQQFYSNKLHGEWFERTPDLITLIKKQADIKNIFVRKKKTLNLDKQLRYYLGQYDWTITKLSEETCIPRTTINEWLYGRQPKDISLIKLVADTFETTIDNLCFGNKHGN